MLSTVSYTHASNLGKYNRFVTKLQPLIDSMSEKEHKQFDELMDEARENLEGSRLLTLYELIIEKVNRLDPKKDHAKLKPGKNFWGKVQALVMRLNLESIISMLFNEIPRKEAETFMLAVSKKRKDIKTILAEVLKEHEKQRNLKRMIAAMPKMLKYKFTLKNWYKELVAAMGDYEKKYNAVPTCIYFQHKTWEKMRIIMNRGTKKVETNPLRDHVPVLKNIKGSDDPGISFFENENGSIRLLLCINDKLGKSQFGLEFAPFGGAYTN